MTDKLLRIGVSTCLLGEPVRYNGGHKRSRLVTDQFSKVADLVGFCPEVAIGLGTPRPPIRLIATDSGTQAVGTVDASINVTEQLADYGKQVAEDELPELDGYIFMQKSPSCGLFRVKQYLPNGYPADESAQGIYAQQLQARYPLMPMEESGRLQDQGLYTQFIIRLMVYREWRQLENNLTKKALLAFHSKIKYLLLACSQEAYRLAGRQLSDLSGDLKQVAQQYIELVLPALRKPPKKGCHTNALQHIFGYLSSHLDEAGKRNLHDTILGYQAEEVSLVVPLALLWHELKRQGSPEYVAQQWYLHAYYEWPRLDFTQTHRIPE
ncbi:YbgA family protein [Salinibius halmophilus]|uniref:YbgA family protein n=1 Tax=Salinibius halmophilus TaxID=1853216 RepID=UPI000E670114|nr:DUF523 and DUF1722 domain-containing protein [Salinibius halmophilus]